MVRRRANTTKREIIQTATRFFLEKGYSATSPKMIGDALELSTGNITYYFPTKEHLLAVLVEMLCGFQRQLLQEIVDEGYTSLMAVCLELTTMAAASEEDAAVKDFFLSAYASPMCLSIIRRNDEERDKAVFAPYCPDFDHQQFAEAEILASGIEYATLMVAGDPVPLDVRIAGALDKIMMIFCVPEEVRKSKIEKVMAMDYRALGRRVLNEFKTYVEEANEHAFEQLLSNPQEVELS